MSGSLPAVRLLLTGAVQGIGLRPQLARLAEQHAWRGFCRNTSQGVEVLLAAKDLTPAVAFDALRSMLPAGCQVQNSEEQTCDTAVLPLVFEIQSSCQEDTLSAEVPRDRAVCAACRHETQDETNRRNGYWLTTCAGCGPRFSILRAMPFDRERTSLIEFPLCKRCRHEYEAPTDRRFHAQTMGCSDCGPQVWCSDRDGRILDVAGDDRQPHHLAPAVEALSRGGIVALRGIGGYQLLTDATCPRAVRQFRARKRRPEKPLAVLCRSIEDARQLAQVCEIEAATLRDSANPIVLLERRSDAKLAPDVCGPLNTVGVMLPTTPLHDALALALQRPLVITSGNIEGEPLAVSVEDSLTQLRDVADVWIHHNRPIRHPVDDSVVRVIAGRTVLLRAARGFAPLPLPLKAPPILACGGHLKSAFALSNGEQTVLCPHVGDLDSSPTRERWIERIAALSSLYDIPSPLIVVDQHPDYFSSQWGLSQPSGLTQITDDIRPPTDAQASSAIPVSRSDSPKLPKAILRIQHHHAHIAAGIVEHRLEHETVLGIAADGSGLGTDGTLWGGEFLRVRRAGCERVGHLRPFALPGGEVAVRDIGRIAVAVLHQLPETFWSEISVRLNRSHEEIHRLRRLAESSQCWQTSSLGRLFDAAAALILGPLSVHSEGFAAQMLESNADPSADGCYSFTVSSGSSGEPLELDWRPAFRQLVEDLCHDVPAAVMAQRFHHGVARGLMAMAQRWPLPTVLGGGVFQNRRLVELLVEEWPAHGPPLCLPGLIPPNDGGLAAGQLAIAAWSISHRSCTSHGDDRSH